MLPAADRGIAQRLDQWVPRWQGLLAAGEGVAEQDGRISQPQGADSYVTWRVGSRDGHQWAAENGCYDLTWPQAVASFISRASLPDPPGPHRPDQEGNGP